MAAAMALPSGTLRRVFSPPAPPPVQAQGERRGAASVRRGRCPERYCRHGERVCQRQMPPKGECFDFVVEQVARTTCQSCTRRSRCCWVRGYATAMDGCTT